MYSMNASSSLPGTSTPIKAIVTPLLTNAAPTIPPSSEIYDYLPKAILRRRLIHNVFAISSLFTWILSGIWTGWQRGGIGVIGLKAWLSNYFSLSTLGFALIWWMLGVLPIVVLRKQYLTATPVILVSPQQTLQAHLTQKRSQRAFLILSISSFAFALVHIVTSFMIEINGRDNPKLGLWANSKKHPYHINGRLVYILSTQCIMAVFFWLRDILRDRFTISLLRGPAHTPSTTTIISFLLPSIVSMAILAILSTSFSTVLFGISRMLIFPLVYRIPLLHALLRPFTAHFLRPTYTISFIYTHFSLITRAYFLNLTTALTWDVGSSLFDVVSSFPVKVSDSAREPSLSLVSGALSNDQYLQLHAFHELAILASVDSADAKAKRSAIYGDMKYYPSMWASLVRQCLFLLGEDYQLLLRRGKPAPPPPAPAPPSEKPPPNPSTPINNPLIHAPIFKASSSTPLVALADSISSEGVITQALTHTTDDVMSISEILKTTRDILQTPKKLFSPNVTPLTAEKSAIEAKEGSAKSTVDACSDSTDSAVTKDGKNNTQRKDKDGLFGNTLKQVKEAYNTALFVYHGSWWKRSAIVRWWTRERVNKTVMRSVPNKELDCMIVQVLASLVKHSLVEDELGQVQRDIPRVLEALLKFHTALEDYQNEFSALLPTMAPEDEIKLTGEEATARDTLKVEIQLSEEWLNDLNDVLRSGLRHIVHTFGERLNAFKFPSHIANKLQAIVDYSI